MGLIRKISLDQIYEIVLQVVYESDRNNRISIGSPDQLSLQIYTDRRHSGRMKTFRRLQQWHLRECVRFSQSFLVRLECEVHGSKKVSVLGLRLGVERYIPVRYQGVSKIVQVPVGVWVWLTLRWPIGVEEGGFLSSLRFRSTAPYSPRTPPPSLIREGGIEVVKRANFRLTDIFQGYKKKISVRHNIYF